MSCACIPIKITYFSYSNVFLRIRSRGALPLPEMYQEGIKF